MISLYLISQSIYRQSGFFQSNIEDIENVESVKTTAETIFKICLIINIESFHDKEIYILHIFNRCLHGVCKLKNQHTDFPYFP